MHQKKCDTSAEPGCSKKNERGRKSATWGVSLIWRSFCDIFLRVTAFHARPWAGSGHTRRTPVAERSAGRHFCHRSRSQMCDTSRIISEKSDGCQISDSGCRTFGIVRSRKMAPRGPPRQRPTRVTRSRPGPRMEIRGTVSWRLQQCH